MFLLSAELDPVILVVASAGVLILAIVMFSMNKLISSNKKLMANQKVHNNLLLIIADRLRIEMEEESMKSETYPNAQSQPLK